VAGSSEGVGDETAFPPPLERSIRLAIVADVCVQRDGLAESLGRQPTINLLGTAASVDDALAQWREPCPDVVVIHMAMSDGMDAVRALVAEIPDAGILALAVPESDVIAWVETGASCCMTPEASLEEIVSAVECTARGEALGSPRMTAMLISRVRALAAERPSEGVDERLTPREQEIVALIDEGLSNKQIATSLCIEPATVKNHVHNILQKLHVARRGEAAAAVRRGPGGGDA